MTTYVQDEIARKWDARVDLMELLGMWKNGNEDGRSHVRFVLNEQKSDLKCT